MNEWFSETKFNFGSRLKLTVTVRYEMVCNAFFNFYFSLTLHLLRKNCADALKTLRVKPQPSEEKEKIGSGRGRRGRKSAKRVKRRRRSAKRSGRRRGNKKGSESVRGREKERENGTEKETGRETGSGTGTERGRGTERGIGIGIGGHVEATPAAATPVEHQTGNGADPAIAGGPGAETRTGTGNANEAGMT